MAAGDIVGTIVQVVPPAADAATPDIRAGGSTPAENVPCWDFDAIAIEYLDFLCFLHNYDDGGLTVETIVSASSATSGVMVMEAAIRRFNDDGEDIDAAHTYVYNRVEITAPSASGETVTGEIDFIDGSEMDSLAEGEWFVLRIRRDATGGDDIMAGDAELIMPVIKEKAA